MYFLLAELLIDLLLLTFRLNLLLSVTSVSPDEASMQDSREEKLVGLPDSGKAR